MSSSSTKKSGSTIPLLALPLPLSSTVNTESVPIIGNGEYFFEKNNRLRGDNPKTANIIVTAWTITATTGTIITITTIITKRWRRIITIILRMYHFRTKGYSCLIVYFEEGFDDCDKIFLRSISVINFIHWGKGQGYCYISEQYQCCHYWCLESEYS